MTAFTDEKLKVAVIGLGKMGLLHASLLSTIPDVEVAALCDKSLLLRKVAKRTLKKAFITNEVDALTNLGLSAVYITTPIPSHYPIIKTVLQDGICQNVFSEKTLSSSFEKSTELCNLSSTHSGVGMVGYMKRFSVTFKKAQELLKNQTLGTPISFNAYAYSSDFADAKAGSTVSLSRGGVLEDLGSHVVDLALWLFGDLQVASAKLQASLTEGAVDDVAFQVTGASDLEGNFEVSWLKPGYRMPEFGITITGTLGKLTVTDTDVKLALDGEAPRVWFRQNLGDTVGFLLGDAEYYRENAHFIESIRSQTEPVSSFASATKVDGLLSQVEKKLHAQ